MKFFLDTEFIESGPSKPIQLISIGMTADSGDSFYAISSEFNPDDASTWVKENVLAKLEPESEISRLPLAQIARSIRHYVAHAARGSKPEFWGYYADYDWVVFCQVFGTMMDLPDGFPMYCRDIKRLCDDKGNPKLPEQASGEHNALADARWNQIAWAFLDSLG